MITQEMFDLVVKNITDGKGCTAEEATELVQTIAEFEQRVAVAQKIVEFVLHAAEQVAEQMMETALREVSIRDIEKVKRLRRIPRQTTEQLNGVVQLYIAQMYALTKPESAVSDTNPDILLNEETA